MLLAGVPQCPSAEQGGGAGEAAELVQAAVGNEQPWKACPGFWSSFTILPEPPQTCPGTALRELCQWCEGWTAWTMLWDFPAHPPGAEGEAGAARAVLCREHKEVCSIVERRSQTCFAADKCTSPSAAFVSWQEWHLQVANLSLPFCVSLLPSPSSWMSPHWFFPPSSLSFTTINQLFTSKALWAVLGGSWVCPHPHSTPSQVHLEV